MVCNPEIDHSTPVVVLPCGTHHSSTCIVRSLGQLEVPVYLVASAPHGLASFSRYCRGEFVWNDEAPASEKVQFLLTVGRQIGKRSILVAASDEMVALVAENADALEEWFIFPRKSPELVQALCSKKEMHQLANRLGVPTPQAAFPVTRGDVLVFLDTAVFPVMLKGIDGNRLAARCGHKMFIVRSASELLEIYDSVEDPDDPNLILQEYIPGSDEAVRGFEGYYNDLSDCLFAGTSRKLRQWPAYQGVTTLGVCCRMKEVETITHRFMKAIGYRGIVDIGYRFDERDGLYKVLDVNPRIGCTFRLFTGENGMDVLRALYLDLTGQTVMADTTPEGRKWVVEDLDLLASRRYLLDRRLSPIDWLRSFRGLRESAYFAPDDPLPFLAMWLKRGRELLRRIRLSFRPSDRTALTGWGTRTSK